jgi:hypothetical protein
VKDLTVRTAGYSTTMFRTKPCEMYRLILDEGEWHPNVKVGMGLRVEWFDENGRLVRVRGDVCYRRRNIIHVNGVKACPDDVV